MWIRSIGARLTFWYTGILSLTLLLLGVLAYGLLTYSLSYDLDAALQGVAKAIATQAHKEGTRPWQPDLPEIFRRFFGFSPPQPLFRDARPFRPSAAGQRLRTAGVSHQLGGPQERRPWGGYLRDPEGPRPLPYPGRDPARPGGRTGDQPGAGGHFHGKSLSHPAPLCAHHGGAFPPGPDPGGRRRLAAGPAGFTPRGPHDQGS